MLRAGVGLLGLVLVTSFPVVAARCGPAMVQLTVLDQGGTSLPGLSPSDFKVRIKNQSTTVVAVDYGIFPHATLLLVSRTATMGQSIKAELARQLAQAVVASSPGPVMAGSYAGDVGALADARAGQVLAAAMQVGGDTRNVVYDAMLAGMATMKLHRGDALVVITDSPDNGSKTMLADLEQQLVLSGARLFVIALPPATNVGGLQSLATLAESTGGALVVPLRLEDATKEIAISAGQMQDAIARLNQVYAQYNNIYQLEMDVEGQERTLPLRIEVEKRKLGGGKIVAPTMLAPCTSIGQ